MSPGIRYPLTMFRTLVPLLASLIATPSWALPPGDSAGLDPRVDARTGADRAVYPPPRHFDHLHMKLVLDIPSMSEAFLRGEETLTVKPIGSPREELVLNAVMMQVESVTAGGAPAMFTHADGLLKVRFARPLLPGTPTDVVIRYSLDFSKNRGSGLTWTGPDANAESETDRAPQIHSQGQPEFNRTWFACHDFPNERLTTELIVTVEDGFQVCSNGRLAGTSRAATGRTTWRWVQDTPHANYLVVLVVGKFALVGLDTSKAGLSRPIPMYLYAPLGSEESARAAYARTPEMIAFFERYFDEPYPWDKYAQLLVRGFNAGGMENTSATTMQDGSAYAPPGSQDDVIAHEAAHQWTGDLITCRSWEHLWLNEGWASFAEALWAEHRAGADPARARRAYQRKIAGFFAGERVMNRTYAPDYPPLASNRYNTPMEVFLRPNSVYSKGAVVLHMLRMRLGDEVFSRGVREYVERFKLREVETDDFRRVMEEVSGLSLERFFDQWTRRPGTPRLTLSFSWDEGSSTLTVEGEQTQTINAENPAFALSVPIEAAFEDGSRRRVVFEIDTKSARRSFVLPAKPADLTADPDLSCGAWTRVSKPLSMWLRQLEHESVFARLQALEHLARFDDAAAGAALARCAAAEPNDDADALVRTSARLALGLRAGRLALADLVRLAAPAHRVALSRH